MKRSLAAIALFALAMGGCGNNPGSASTPRDDVPTAPPDAGGVLWADYAPTLQAQIDALAAAKNCDDLQEQFDSADANNQVTINRVGHNNSALMAYIDSKMRAAGCY